MDGMNMSTLLGKAVRGLRGALADDGVGRGNRQRLVLRVCDRGGESRCLFGAGGGPAEAAAEAKQESMRVRRNTRQFVKKFVSEQWILSFKSLGCPLVYHL
jgi:hypothetical protein